MSFKFFLGILSIIPAVLAYFLYFRGMLSANTKPHAFSWLIWGLLAANGFFAQISADAGIGAWVTGLTSVACLTISLIAFFKGDTQPTKLDWVLLSLALLAMVMLFVVDNAVIGLSITIFAVVMGFSIAVRKAYHHPHTETPTTYLLNAVKFVPAIFALQSFSFLTVAYPLTAILGNVVLVFVLYVQTKKRGNKTNLDFWL